MDDPSSTASVSVQYLQMLVEQEKTALARAIHDDLGGHLIATAMDLALLKRRFAGSNLAAVAEIERATVSLTAAIDMMRRVTEELHPTLLDNVGLWAALRWLINDVGQGSDIVYKHHFPTAECRLKSDKAINVFRIGQEALTVSGHRTSATRVEVFGSMDETSLQINVDADGSAEPPAPGSRGHVALAFLQHRIDAMNGSLSIKPLPEGGMRLAIQMTLDASSMSETQLIRTLEMPQAEIEKEKVE